MMTHHRKPHDDRWPAVPGRAPAPFVEIAVLLIVCIGLLAGAVGTVGGFLVALAGVLS